MQIPDRGLAILRLEGELDFARAPALAVDAAEHVRAGRDVIIDLRAVSFLDSAAMAMLLNACRRATRAGLGFCVVCPPGPARRSLQVARLEETLHVCDGEEEAKRRLRSSPRRML